MLIAALTMDLAGRKVLLFVSASIMFAANLTLGLYVQLGPRHVSPNSTTGLEDMLLGGTEQTPAAPPSPHPGAPAGHHGLHHGLRHGLGAHHLAAHVGDPALRARGVASGLCVLVSWLTAFVLTKSFLLLVDAFGLQTPFFLFAAVCLLSLLFTGCCVPETKGRSLEQIESFFHTGRRSFLR